MPKILILENNASLNHLMPSGSYWFRLEMAFGWHALGWAPYLIQHPCLHEFPWVEVFRWNPSNGIDLEEFDLILLLGDFPSNADLPTDSPVVYWDIEGLPRDPRFFNNLLQNSNWGNETACGSRETSLREELRGFYYHFQKQKLRYWTPSHIYSIARKPILENAAYLPMGSEIALYNFRNVMFRDIRLAIVGQIDHWFAGKERTIVAENVLRNWGYPVTYWFGITPENSCEGYSFPQNCFPMGKIDFLSIRYTLQRIRYLFYIPRPYHHISEAIGATLFQSLAAGAIPLHTFVLDVKLGYSVRNVKKLEDLEQLPFSSEYTYQHRFQQILEDIF